MSGHADQGIVTVRLRGELYRLLRERVYAEQVSYATLVRQALAAYLEKGQAPIVSPGRSWELDDADRR